MEPRWVEWTATEVPGGAGTASAIPPVSTIRPGLMARPRRPVRGQGELPGEAPGPDLPGQGRPAGQRGLGADHAQPLRPTAGEPVGVGDHRQPAAVDQDHADWRRAHADVGDQGRPEVSREVA